MPFDLTALGKVIRQERARRALSQEDLADLSALSRAYVGEIERGEVNPSFGTVVALAQGLGIPLASLAAEYERRAKAG